MNTILIRDGLLVEPNRSWPADILSEGEKIFRVESHIDPMKLPKDPPSLTLSGFVSSPV